MDKSPCVLRLDQQGEVHAGIHRWLLDAPVRPAFVVFTTYAPQELPAGFTRSDVLESVWHLDLPAGYQAETHGNLTRKQVAGNAPPSHVTLTKNLCRDERPQVQLFYQRQNLKP